MTTKTSYITNNGQPVWVLYGSQGRRAYHLTADPTVNSFVNEVTYPYDLPFASLCGLQIVDTLVATSTTSPESVCKACARKAIKEEEE